MRISRPSSTVAKQPQVEMHRGQYAGMRWAESLRRGILEHLYDLVTMDITPEPEGRVPVATGRERMIEVAVVQMATRPYDAAAARAASVCRLHEAFAAGADVVVLPELIVPGYGVDAALVAGVAEPLDGPTVTAWAEVAAARGGLVVGGFAERDGPRLFNAAVAVSRDGVLLHYRKLHPFAAERCCFAEGDLGLPVAMTPWGAIGVCVCYDLRFVETLRMLSLAGAELVCVPTAWVAGFDAPHDAGPPPQAAAAILQANLDQVYVACSSQTGTPGNTRLLGGSLVASPRGEVLAGPMVEGQMGASHVRIDLDDVMRSRTRGKGISPRKDRRPDVYGLGRAGL